MDSALKQRRTKSENTSEHLERYVAMASSYGLEMVCCIAGYTKSGVMNLVNFLNLRILICTCLNNCYLYVKGLVV